MSKPDVCKRICAALALFAATVIASPAQTFTTLHSFDGSDGATPTFPSLTQGLDGNLYGTTAGGGTQGQGTIFDISPQGTFTTVYSFCILKRCDDGKSPRAGVILGTAGNFWGTTESGGGQSWGGMAKGCSSLSSREELRKINTFLARLLAINLSAPRLRLQTETST